ncbi:MAG: hypothetical protein ACREN2_12025 [Candidatus Dormibacteria bacterium]
MAVYVIVGLVVLAGLVLAYRSLGRPAAVTIESAAVLRSTLTATERAASDLAELARAAPMIGADAGSEAGTAKALRRRLTGLSQQLELVDPHELDESDESAHALLEVSIDELSSAAGMCATDAYASSDGMRTAVSALLEHAGRCLHDAATLVASAEEVERAP